MGVGLSFNDLRPLVEGGFLRLCLPESMNERKDGDQYRSRLLDCYPKVREAVEHRYWDVSLLEEQDFGVLEDGVLIQDSPGYRQWPSDPERMLKILCKDAAWYALGLWRERKEYAGPEGEEEQTAYVRQYAKDARIFIDLISSLPIEDYYALGAYWSSCS